MKKIMCLLLIIQFSCTEKDEILSENNYDCTATISQNNMEHPLAQSVQEIMVDLVSKGVPGIMMSIHTEEDEYYSSSFGKNDLANNINIKTCDITRVGSTVKTFTAVTILKLQEEGKLQLDDLITQYLPDKVLSGLSNSKEATIKQLLQHSSGIYNYIQDLQFQTASLNDLTKVWTPNELLNYARNQDSYFAPENDVRYSNTGYILLGMIIEVVEKRPFYQVFEEKIFNPLQLEFTQFAAQNPVPHNIIRGYIDLYSNNNLINSTHYSGWDYFTADGGLISNPYNLNVFMTSLFQSNILTQESLQEMTNWVAPNEQDSEGFKTYYGLGIFKIETEFGDAYLHSGDAIGYFASMVYFPEQKITITWAVNANYGKLDDRTQSKVAMESIFRALLN